MEGVLSLSSGGIKYVQRGVLPRAALKLSFLTIWTIVKILHYIRVNSRHARHFLLWHIFSCGERQAMAFARRNVTMLTTSELGIDKMSSSFVTLWGLVKGVDKVGKAILCCSSEKDFTSTSLSTLTREFQDLGGVINHSAEFDLVRGEIVGTYEKVQLSPSDHVATVCEFGRNRSRKTTEEVLRLGIKPEQALRPHGGVTGFDILHDLDHHELVSGLASLKNTIFGHDREDHLLRNGVHETQGMDRAERRDWMERNYFDPIIEKKAIVIAYDHGFHAMLLRLVLCAKHTSRSLAGVRIVPIIAEDPHFIGAGGSEWAFDHCVRQIFSCKAVG